MTENKLFTADMFAAPEDEVGLRVSAFGDAICAWVVMQRRHTTIAQAARAFNTTANVVAGAVNDHPWMFVAGVEGAGPELQFIELDGE